MKKKSLVFAVFALAVCVCMCGGWTYASAQQPPGETYYTGAIPFSTYAEERIDYTQKTVVDNISTAGLAPRYTEPESLQNACAAVAGAVIVGFYDKYFNDLIPSWESHAAKTGNYKPADKVYIPAIIEEFFVSMHTNEIEPGATENDFKTGLQNYVTAHGHTVNYQSTATTTSLDYMTCKTAISNNKVVALLMRAGNLYTYNSGDGYDTFTSISIPAPHIVVAYGCLQFHYRLSNGGEQTEIFLRVSTGLKSNHTAYYRVNQHNLNAAYVINID